jgi:hypothetical protein
MAYSRVNYRAPLRVGRDRRRGRPEMSLPSMREYLTSLWPELFSLIDQLFWQRAPICAELYGNVTHSVVVAVADEIIHISA